MQNRFILTAALIVSAAVLSCNKGQEEVTCIQPKNESIQGSWKQNFPKDDVFQSAPEWEKIEFKRDSFFMRVRLRTDMLSEKNCFESTWLEYTKGVYVIDSHIIYFNGIYTDSNYKLKADGCHSIGKYNVKFGIKLCDNLLALKVLLDGIPEEMLKVDMYRN